MKFTDFFKPRWKHSDPRIRTEAIKEMESEYHLSDLVQIATSDELTDNQKLALKKINDEDALQKVMHHSTEKSIQEGAKKKLNELWARKIIKSPGLAPVADILNSIDDQKSLEEIALQHADSQVREICQDKLKQAASILKVALKEKEPVLAMKALSRVIKPSHLDAISKKARCKSVRTEAKERIQQGSGAGGGVSEEKIAEAKFELLANSMSSLLPPESWRNAAEKAEELDEAWIFLTSQQVQPDNQLKDKFETGKKEFWKQYNDHKEKAESRHRQENQARESLQARTEICSSLDILTESKKTEERDENIKGLIARWESLPAVNDADEEKLSLRFRRLVQRFSQEQNEKSNQASADDAIRQNVQSREELIQNLYEQAVGLLEGGASAGGIRQRFIKIKEQWMRIRNIEEHASSIPFQELEQKIEAVAAASENEVAVQQAEALKKMNELVPLFEGLVDNPDLVSAEKSFRDLNGRWKDLDTFKTPQDQFSQAYEEVKVRFQKAYDRFREAQEWQRWANLKKKQDICDQLEGLLKEDFDSQALFKKLRELQQDWKNIGPVSWDSSKEVWDRYRMLTDDCYERCKEYFGELEEERNTNLAKKEELFQLVEKQLATENWKESSEIIKEAQLKWKDIGPVPKEKSDEVWERFRNACDNFFASRKVYFSGLEAEKDQNLSKKEEICEMVESLKDSSDWKGTAAIFKKAQDDWKSIGPVPKENMQEIWERFRITCDYFFSRRDAYFRDVEGEKGENLKKKEALIEQIEHLQDIENDAEKFNLIKKAQSDWKAIGPVDRNIAEELWERFRKPIDAYFETRKDRFEEEQKIRQDNLTKKEDLCSKALELSESKNWKETSEKLKMLQSAWKEIGPAPRENDKEIWLRFREACDSFFSRMKEHYRQLDDQRELNLRTKEDICFQAESLAGFANAKTSEGESAEQVGDAGSINWHEKTLRIKDLQRDWKKVGPVPKSKSENLWDRFRRACDYVFDYARTEETGHAVDFESNLQQKIEIVEEAERISRQVHTDAQIQKIKDLQRRWKSIGPVAETSHDEVWTKFKKCCDLVFQEDERLGD